MIELLPAVRPNRHVHATLTPEGGMLLDTRGRGRWYALTPTGAAFWRLLRQGENPDEAVSAMARHYGVPAQRVRGDVAVLIGELASRRLVDQRRWWSRW